MGGLLCLVDGHGLVVTMRDIDNRPPHHACFGLAMHMQRKRKIAHVGIVLGEFKFLYEEGRRFNHLPFGPDEAAAVGVNENPAFEQARTLHSRLDMKDVNEPVVHMGRAFVRKLVILLVNGRERPVIFLDMIHFRLQQARDYIALDESIAGVVNRGELEGVRGRKMPLDFNFALLFCLRELGADDGNG